ncbi:hypothetical protein AXG93_488s1140 [Marchantia polymorpha subsp. ruderalis]|uniref:Uncharacterized protein n=1 Tax=Marchantia polymorpha subsp. ruderalis TaxID=1480154 RepID=A0A176W6G2_MARPO|nr:hypothetical protein AXG93_488s1140 [Marchantia polymorpha subsp. ruderalis]
MATIAIAAIETGILTCHRVEVGARVEVAALSRYSRCYRARWSFASSSWKIRGSRGEDDRPSPMEIWPGVSSPVDFEFGFQVPQEETSNLDEFESIAGFSGIEDSILQTYMGDVDMLEEEEPLSKFVPPPQIPLEGPMAVLLDDQRKWDAVVKMFSESVEIQDPLLCLKGVQSFKTFLRVLCESGINIDLHEVYYENLAADRSKRWVYAVWTATLTNNLEESVENLNMKEWWSSAFGSLLEHLAQRQDGVQNALAGDELFRTTTIVDGEEKHFKRFQRLNVLKLSGESKFEVNQAGLVTGVRSRWYKLREQDAMEFSASKLWLTGLFSRGM